MGNHIIDNRYLVHSERFFFFSDMSVSSIMNRIYLCFIGLVILLLGNTVYDYVYLYLDIGITSVYGVKVLYGIYDAFEYGICVYIVYIICQHSFEYICKYIFIGVNNTYKISYENYNLYAKLCYYYFCMRDGALKKVYFSYELFKVVIIIIIICSVVYMYNLLCYSDTNILSVFYIDQLTFGICYDHRCSNEWFCKLETLSFFKYIYGFDYISSYDKSNVVNVAYNYYLFKTYYDYIYMGIFLIIYIFLVLNTHINKFIVRNMYYLVYVYILNMFFFKKLYYSYILCGIVAIYVYYMGYNTVLLYLFDMDIVNSLVFIFNVNIFDYLYSNSLIGDIIDIYRLAYAYNLSPLGQDIDNSKFFWPSTCGPFKSFTSISEFILLESLPGTYAHKCIRLSLSNSTYSIVFNLLNNSLNIYSWKISWGMNRLLFDKYFIFNEKGKSPMLEITRPLGYIDISYIYLYDSIFERFQKGTSKFYSFFNCSCGSNDSVIMRIHTSGASLKPKYYNFIKKPRNTTVIHNGSYLFDYDALFNNRMSNVHYLVQ